MEHPRFCHSPSGETAKERLDLKSLQSCPEVLSRFACLVRLVPFIGGYMLL
jgi:hypothetical protein